MKTLTIIFILISFSGLTQQDVWTNEETAVLDYYGLTKTDGRGVIFHNASEDCSEVFTNEKLAIIDFFTSIKKSDIHHFCLSNSTLDVLQLNFIYDLHDIVKLYLRIPVE